jgi:hypothetical protein
MSLKLCSPFFSTYLSLLTGSFAQALASPVHLSDILIYSEADNRLSYLLGILALIETDIKHYS